MEVQQKDVTSLADKLNGLDLTDAESAILGALLSSGDPADDVAGYERGFKVEIQGFNIGMPPSIKIELGRA